MKLMLLTTALSAALYNASAKAETHAYEIQLAPTFGYSNFSGFSYGLGTKLGFALDNHWQMVMGGNTWVTRHGLSQHWTGNLGLQYNFSEDWTRSFYLAGGAGYGDVRAVETPDGKILDKGAFGFLTVGKRFALNESGSISWRPEISVEAGNFGDHNANITFMPLNFSYSF